MRTTKIFLVTAVLALTACNPTTAPVADDTAAAMTKEEVATTVVRAIKNNDFAAVAEFVHPTFGVQFTAETTINPEWDVLLKPEELKALAKSTEKKNWGVAQGSGEPIELSLANFRTKYLYDKDYASATDVQWNQPMNLGTALDNATAVFPNHQIVTYLIPAKEEGGLDWSALRLVLKQEGEEWYLVGVIHDHWTP